MAKIEIIGFPIPFGIQSPNKMFRADSYAGPYDTVADALDTIEPAIRELGREVGIIRADGRGVDIYAFEKDASNNWDLVKRSDSGGVSISRTSDIPINDGEDGTSRYTEETDFKTIGGQSIIGGGDITIGLQLGETDTTAYRGDRGKHSYDSIIEMEDTNFSTQFLTILNF